jgi:tRNA(Arg) A34 adenosine deaminase TadA
VKTFLDPVTASKIVFCGTNLDILNEQFTKDHPYVQYLHTRQNTKGSKARDLVPLPKVSPHEPTWQIAVAEDAAGLEGPAKAVAVPVEAVRVSDQDFQQRLSSGSMSSSRDERESWTSQHDMIKSFDQVRSSPSASAKSFDREQDSVASSHQSESASHQSEGMSSQQQQEPSAEASGTLRTAGQGFRKIKYNYGPLNASDYTTSDLVDIAKQLQAAVPVKDRTYRLKYYAQVAIGSDIVEAFMALGHVRTIEQAESLGDLIIGDKLMKHVSSDHGLKNKYLFYTFSKVLDAPTPLPRPRAESQIQFLGSTGMVSFPNQAEMERQIKRVVEVSRVAGLRGDYPYGASLVDDSGRVLYERGNTEVTTVDPTAHAEINLVRDVIRSGNKALLRKSVFYASTEPCGMYVCSWGRPFSSAPFAVLSSPPLPPFFNFPPGHGFFLRCCKVMYGAGVRRVVYANRAGLLVSPAPYGSKPKVDTGTIETLMATGNAHECVVVHGGEDMERLARSVVDEFEQKGSGRLVEIGSSSIAI